VAVTTVAVPKEIKADEFRVAMTPAGVREVGERGHTVVVQAGAGVGSGIPDAAYSAQGARVVRDAAAVFDLAEVIVKEPLPGEVSALNKQHTLFSYLHLAADVELTRGLIASGASESAVTSLQCRRAGR
jgi:alanine dehydrogenase